jgi:hypothetical protein
MIDEIGTDHSASLKIQGLGAPLSIPLNILYHV